MPLLGNPSAAVLYPGKLVYGLLSYAWAARLYVVGHVLLAFAGQWLLLRSWGVGPAGAAMGGLAYAFGGPVVFQYSNIIFLVGAAWAPWGFRAADRLLRLGRRWAIWELALVLAMETLGGDPQTAYLTVVSAGGYAVGMSLCGGAGWRRWSNPALWRMCIGAGIVVILWGIAVVVAAHLMFGNRPGLAPATPPARIPIEALSLAAWGMGGMAVVWHWWRRRAIPAVGRCLLALLGSAALAAGLSATQLLPAIEFVSHSLRAIPDGPHAVYSFSVEPWRAVEWVWPNIFGPMLDTRQNLLELIPPRHVVLPWVPSLYLGCATLVLSLVAAGFRGGPPWRAWMTALALISFVASIGEYASPLWWGRSVPGWQTFLGNHDPPGVTRELRGDGTLLDGDGSPYWLLTMALPGFGAFRYPGKLLTLTSLSLSALAGMGWDKLLARRSVRVERWSLGVLALTLVLLSATTLGRDRLVARLEARVVGRGDKGRARTTGRGRGQQSPGLFVARRCRVGDVVGSGPLRLAPAPPGRAFDNGLTDTRPGRCQPNAHRHFAPGGLRSKAEVARIDRAGRAERARSGSIPCPSPDGLVSGSVDTGGSFSRRRTSIVRLVLVDAHTQGGAFLRTGIHFRDGDSRAGGLFLVLLPHHDQGRRGVGRKPQGRAESSHCLLSAQGFRPVEHALLHSADQPEVG